MIKTNVSITFLNLLDEYVVLDGKMKKSIAELRTKCIFMQVYETSNLNVTDLQVLKIQLNVFAFRLRTLISQTKRNIQSGDKIRQRVMYG